MCSSFVTSGLSQKRYERGAETVCRSGQVAAQGENLGQSRKRPMNGRQRHETFENSGRYRANPDTPRIFSGSVTNTMNTLSGTSHSQTIP